MSPQEVRRARVAYKARSNSAVLRCVAVALILRGTPNLLRQCSAGRRMSTCLF